MRWVFKLTNKCFGVPQRLPCCVKVSILSMLVNFYIPYLLPCQWIPFFAPTYLLTLRSESVPVTSTPKCGKETRDFTIRWRDASEDVASQMNFFAITPTHVLCQRLANPPGVEFLRTIFKFRKRIKVCRRLFTSSLKSKIRQFHFVVLQKRPRNLQKSEMHLQSCCFAYWTCCCLTFSLQSRSGIVKSLLSDTWRATLEIGAA